MSICHNLIAPTWPNLRVPQHMRPVSHSTVYVKGLRDEVSKINYVERLNSIGGRFNHRCSAISAVSIGLHATKEGDFTQHEYRGRVSVSCATAEPAGFAVSELSNREAPIVTT